MTHNHNMMGSVLSVVHRNPEQANIGEEITENDEFHDAVDNVELMDNMRLAHPKYHEYLETDAVESKNSPMFVNTSNITYEKIADIEPELDYYEKVSLVFLLYEQEDNALQSLLVEQANINHGSTTNILSDWAKSKHLSSSTWQDRFIEALCVIQNYALLRKLGFAKEEMKERYIPTQPYTFLHLNKVMKALYYLCEQLTATEAKTLVAHLAADFDEKGMQFQEFENNYLEMYLLDCFSKKYIKKDNLSNLIAILKKMGLISKADKLEFVLSMDTKNSLRKNTQENVDNKYNLIKPAIKNSFNEIDNKNNRNFDLTEPTENYANTVEPSCSENSVIGDNSIVKNMPSNEIYDIDPKSVGICLIINQKHFYKEKKNNDNPSLLDDVIYLEVPKNDLEERQGTDIDTAALSKIFKKLGFRIIIYENLHHREFIPTIKKVMGQFSKEDSCFVTCILSHGVEKKIYAANSVPVSINDIRDTLHDRLYPTLLGKPKLLIIQSCQGNEVQKVYRVAQVDDIETDGPSNNYAEYNLINDNSGVPEKRDLLIAMSTVSGFASIRSRNAGTWYIQELCKVMDEKCEDYHLQDILTIVNDHVSNRRWEKKGKGIVTMVPEVTTTLSKMLFLRKIKPSSA